MSDIIAVSLEITLKLMTAKSKILSKLCCKHMIYTHGCSDCNIYNHNTQHTSTITKPIYKQFSTPNSITHYTDNTIHMGTKINITLVLIAVLGYYIHGFLQHNGAFRKFYNLNNESCIRIKDAPIGMEDIVINKAGYAFMSNDNRRWFHGVKSIMPTMTPEEQSEIWIYNMNLPQAQRKVIKLHTNNIDTTAEPQRHYHGIYLRESSTGSDFLYAITHTMLGEAVYIMKVNYKNNNKSHEPQSLDLIGIIRDPNEHNSKKIFKALNDIVSIQAGSSDKKHIMYATNWIGVGQDSSLVMFETLTQRPWGYVVKIVAEQTGTCVTCWNIHTEKAIEGLLSPNGIEVNLDQTSLITVESGGKRILHFKLNGENVEKTPYLVQPHESHHDNIGIDQATGDLYIGSHPSGLAFVKHRDAPNHTEAAPSEVIKLTYNKQNHTYGEPVTVLMSNGNDNDGKHISASTVAARYKNDILIGSVFVPGFMVCNNVPF